MPSSDCCLLTLINREERRPKGNGNVDNAIRNWIRVNEKDQWRWTGTRCRSHCCPPPWLTSFKGKGKGKGQDKGPLQPFAQDLPASAEVLQPSVEALPAFAQALSPQDLPASAEVLQPSVEPPAAEQYDEAALKAYVLEVVLSQMRGTQLPSAGPTVDRKMAQVLIVQMLQRHGMYRGLADPEI